MRASGMTTGQYIRKAMGVARIASAPAPITPPRAIPALCSECPICSERIAEEPAAPSDTANTEEPAQSSDIAEPAPSDDTAEPAPQDDIAEPAPSDDTAEPAPHDDEADDEDAEHLPGVETSTNFERFVFPCGHNCCRPCAAAYVAVEVESGRLPLRCFDQSCRAEEGNAIFREFLSGEQLERVYQWEFERAIAGDPRFVACPAPNCRGVSEMPSEARRFSCPVCALVTCRACKKAPHSGPCAEDLPEDVQAYSRAANVQRCPSCNSLVEKNGGCNQMKCRCGASFCYLCGEKITGAHFRPGHGQYDDPKNLTQRSGETPDRSSRSPAVQILLEQLDLAVAEVRSQFELIRELKAQLAAQGVVVRVTVVRNSEGATVQIN